MTRKERIAKQRIMARDAISKLRGVSELFGVETPEALNAGAEFELWNEKIDAIERFIFDESPIA